MAAGSIEVSGPDAERLADELRAALGRAVAPGGSVSAVEVSRSPELVVAVVGVVFAGVSAAKAIWDWWDSRRSAGVTVRIVFDDGTRLELETADRTRLEIELERRTPPSQ